MERVVIDPGGEKEGRDSGMIGQDDRMDRIES